MMKQRKRLTWRKADRALCALVELIECGDATPEQRRELNRCAEYVRALRDGLKR